MTKHKTEKMLKKKDKRADPEVLEEKTRLLVEYRKLVGGPRPKRKRK